MRPWTETLNLVLRPIHETLHNPLCRCYTVILAENEVDLQNKLDDFTDYYNNHRVHASLDGEIPAKFGEKRMRHFTSLANFNWKTLCRGLVQLPIAA